MKVAVVGSRSLHVRDLSLYLPDDTTELVSGGARGVDASAREYAEEQGIPLTELLPDYALYGNKAPLKRNMEIIEYSDQVLIFWDGRSRGTYFVISQCRKRGKPHRIFVPALPIAEDDEI